MDKKTILKQNLDSKINDIFYALENGANVVIKKTKDSYKVEKNIIKKI